MQTVTRRARPNTTHIVSTPARAWQRDARAALDKPNVLGSGLDDASMARLRAGTAARYEQMTPAREALRRLSDALEARHANGWDASRIKRLRELASGILSLYLNPEQYHSAEHALTVTADAVELMRECRLTDRAAELRVIVACLYHDTGNGRHPDLPGKDERQSIEVFLADVCAAREHAQRGEDPEYRCALVDLSDQDVLHIAGNILGTVFRDRHATVEQLTKLPVSAEAGQIDYVADVVRVLRDANLEVTKQGLAELMVSKEALIVKNADVLASLRAGNVLKNGFTNFHEDTLRAPGLFRGQAAAQYRSGFKSFLRGDFHGFTHGDEPTPALEQARSGSLLLGPAGGRRLGRKLTRASDRMFALYAHFDGEILDGMQTLISDANDPDTPQRASVIDTPLSQLRPRLVTAMGIGDDEFDRHYGASFTRHGSKSVVEMSPNEVNETFGARTTSAR